MIRTLLSAAIRLAAPAALLAGASASAFAQTADNVLLVVNSDVPASAHVGDHYATRRGLAPDHIVRVQAGTAETIERADYERLIERPIAAALGQAALQDRVLYIVLSKGMPLRVAGTGGTNGTVASVDSELTLLYRKMLGARVPILGHVDNPLFLGDRAIDAQRRVTRFDLDIYLVSRLDGFAVEDVISLIDRSLAPSREGRIVLDEKATAIDRGGDRWLAATAATFADAPDRVLLESTPALAEAEGPVLGYYSWGSNDPSNTLRQTGLAFVPGAVAALFVSTDGRTFVEPQPGWRPGPSTGQSLAGDLIREGVTGVAAHVDEPYLGATIRPQILFPSYLAGAGLVDAFYLAMPYLSWQTVVIGDPLCAPFATTRLSPADIADGEDPETGLPALFSRRRLEVLSVRDLSVPALTLVLKAEAANNAGDPGAARRFRGEAAELEPRLTGVQLQLASAHLARGEIDEAMDRFRRVLEVDQDNIIALNDLAYILAVDAGKPREALPLAQRAARLAMTPSIADTLAWIHHLLGDDAAARPLLETALAGAPGTVDIQVHAAFVFAAVGDRQRARTHLAEAERLDPTIADRDDIKVLKERIR